LFLIKTTTTRITTTATATTTTATFTLKDERWSGKFE